MVVKEEVSQTTTEESIDDYFIKRDKLKLTNRLKMLIWGKFGLGKSYFALTCKEPVYVISTEPESVTPLLVHFPDKDIRIMECSMPYADAPVRKNTGKKDTTPVATDPELALNKLAKATELLRDVTEGTIVLDSVSDVWEYFGAWIDYNADKYTQSGQMMRTEWGKVNSRYKTLINRLMSRPVDFVMTARSENVYEGAQETTKQKMSGQKKTGYIPHIVMEITQKPKTIDGKSTIQTVGVIRKGRGLETTAVGLTIERPTYDKLKKALKDHGGESMFA
jgi:hypothetical protein